MKRSGLISAFAAAAGAVSLAHDPSYELLSSRPVGPGRRSYRSRMVGFPANINRHTGEPHEHKREIARRLRQIARSS